MHLHVGYCKLQKLILFEFTTTRPKRANNMDYQPSSWTVRAGCLRSYRRGARRKAQGALEEWNDMFKKHGLKMNLDKTEVMWVGKHREELNIRLEGKDIKASKEFCVSAWVETYLRTGEWRWRCDAEYKQERMHGET